MKDSQTSKVTEYSFEIYSSGLVHCSVCTDAPREEIETLVNEHNPTGLKHGWHFSDDKTFRGGQPNPAPCETHPNNKHYLMVC